MKKSIYLIAPLAFLASCTASSEIFDDAYNGTEKKTAVVVEEEGYADYIKNEEGYYKVVVDSGNTDNYRNGINPSYYTSTRNSGFNANNNPNAFYGDNNQRFNDDFGWSMTNGRCAPGSYFGYSGFYPMGWQYGDAWGRGGYMTYMTPGGHWNTWYGNPAFSNHYIWNNNGIYYGYNNYFSGQYNGWGTYYDPTWGYYGGGYGNYNGWGSPYGNYYGWGNSYGNYYDPWGNWYGGYPFGYGIYSSTWNGNGMNNGNNWNWGEPSNTTNTGNHHYGHRGGTNTGSQSQNNTNYEHTVKGPVVASNSPFQSYSSANENIEANNAFSSNTVSQPSTTATIKPNNVSTSNGSGFGNGFTNNTSTFEQPATNYNTQVNNSNFVKPPVNSGNNVKPNVVSSNNTVSKTGKTSTVKPGLPAQNQFSSAGSGGKQTFSNNTTNYSNGGSTIKNNSYAHPNKYGQANTNQNYSNNSSNTYYSGNVNSTSRRTNTNTNTSNTRYNSNTNYNSGNRRTNSSTNYGNRSSSSSSSGSSSSSSGGTSRRR